MRWSYCYDLIWLVIFKDYKIRGNFETIGIEIGGKFKIVNKTRKIGFDAEQ